MVYRKHVDRIAGAGPTVGVDFSEFILSFSLSLLRWSEVGREGGREGEGEELGWGMC